VSFGQSWQASALSFLEPNTFTVTKQLDRSIVWLEMGVGRDVLSFGALKFGLEGKEWSRLRYLEGFRFPVETADYFFGVYSVLRYPTISFRFRASHISSHWVDGTTEAVVGGSSSRFSREFLILEAQKKWLKSNCVIKATGGIKYTLHQVQDLEPAVSVPLTVAVTDYNENIEFGVSSCAGPSFPTYGAMLSVGAGPIGAPNLKAQIGYFYGYSRTGVELAKPKSSFIEVGTTVSVF